ncbi:MAG: CBS domain-containing protein [Bacteroidales bacterium]|jgi:CBS domain-containing protein|nr:CBS domain-containing protein [Bacteroidales bacterium]
MLVSKIVENKGKMVVTVTEKSSVYETVKRLDQTNAGAALVVNEKDELVGIISERDILYKCYKTGKSLDGTNLVKDLMTSADQLIVGKMDDDDAYLMKAMLDKHIRHIPILDGEEIVSIIAIEDVLRAVLESSESEAKLLREYIKNPFGVHAYK